MSQLTSVSRAEQFLAIFILTMLEHDTIHTYGVTKVYAYTARPYSLFETKGAAAIQYSE